MNAQQKEQTEKLRDELKDLLAKEDYDNLKKKMDELEQAMAAAQQYMNQQAQNNGSNNSNDDVVDADFSEKQ